MVCDGWVEFDSRKADELGSKCAAMVYLVGSPVVLLESGDSEILSPPSRDEWVGMNPLMRDGEFPKGKR